MLKTTTYRSPNGQVVSAKAARRAERRKAIKEAAKDFVPGTWDKLFNKIK